MKSAAFETLSLNLLKTFCVFAEVGKVEETAQRLRITQASVSLQLKKLEEETGQILFKTVGRKKLLSSFARDLFQSIAPPLHELEHRLKEVSKTQVPLQQRILRIGCRSDLIKIISPLIEFPGQVLISQMPFTQALSALKNDEIDVAILNAPEDSNDWSAKKILIEQPVLIANPKIVKSKDWNSIVTQLTRYPAIAFKKPATQISTVIENLGGKTSELKIKLYCEDWLTIIENVKKTSTWSVLPRIYEEELNGLTVIDVPEKVIPKRNIYSVFNKRWRGMPLIKSKI